VKQIPILGFGVQSGFPSITAQSRINFYLENVGDPEKTQIVAYGTPGLVLFADMGDTPIRGVLSYADFYYFVHRGTFYKINNAGITTSLGMIGTSSGRAFLAHNGFQILIVDGTSTGYIYQIVADKTCTITNAAPAVITCNAHGYVEGNAIVFSTTGGLPTGLTAGTTYYVKYLTVNTFNVAATSGGVAINTSSAGSGVHTVSSVLTTITAAGFPTAGTCANVNGYFVVSEPNTGRFHVSGLYAGLNWDALDFATAESNSDNLKAVFEDHGECLLLGDFTTEFWGSTGATDFAFGRTGTPIEFGMVGYTAAKVNNMVVFLARNRTGEVQVLALNGYSPQRVSTNDMERILNSYSTLDGATAYSYMINGHSMYVLNVGGYTWLYDMTTGCWSQLLSSGITRHRAEMGDTFINKILVTDYSNGRMYRYSSTAYTDNGQPIVASITGKHIQNKMQRLFIRGLQVEFEPAAGIATGQGSDPQAMLEISHDGGQTFGSQRWATMGKIGETIMRSTWGRLGGKWDNVFRISISDPVPRVIINAYIEAHG
jgi:hypothetical protein